MKYLNMRWSSEESGESILHMKVVLNREGETQAMI
jgi:hypothetical protein